MNPLAPLVTNLALRASASSSGDLLPALEADAVSGLPKSLVENSL